jgi:hypothetical protein
MAGATVTLMKADASTLAHALLHVQPPITPLNEHPKELIGTPQQDRAMPRFKLNAPDVIQDTIDGEVLIVHTRTGCYYSLSGSGTQIGEALLTGCPVEDIASLFTGNGQHAVMQQVEDFVHALLHAQHICAEDRAPAEAPATRPATEFTTPQLRKFTDMQELLLVDPIHEVNPQQGWPIQRNDA